MLNHEKQESMKNKKEIPQSWQYFHELVLAHQNGSDFTLTNLYEHARCASDLPYIYKKLGWIAMGETPNFYRYLGPKSEKITPEMAAQIRANWGNKKVLKTISKPSQKSQAPKSPELPPESPPIPPGSKFTSIEYVKKYGWRGLDDLTDEELVSELRRRGCEVTARKTVEL